MLSDRLVPGRLVRGLSVIRQEKIGKEGTGAEGFVETKHVLD